MKAVDKLKIVCKPRHRNIQHMARYTKLSPTKDFGGLTREDGDEQNNDNPRI